MDLFVSGRELQAKPAGDRPRQLSVLITVKAAPQPSATYGETVCVAGLSTDLQTPGWLRLYPINFRYLEQDIQFRKYDLVVVDAVPARGDGRKESWRPRMNTLRVVRHLPDWKRRQPWVTPYIQESMCALRRAVVDDPLGPSLALIRARQVQDFEVSPHPGWPPDEQRKIDRYVSQLDLFGDDDHTPLQAPAMRGRYRWTCHDTRCQGHRQGLLDWEFVALQRRLAGRDPTVQAAELREKFLTQMCAGDRDVCFYVGNQAKSPRTFSVLGVYYPRAR